MTVTPGSPLRFWPNGLIALLSCALIGVTVISVISTYWAEEESKQLSNVPCSQDCQTTVLPRSGLTVVQLGQGDLINGTYFYQFLLTPEPPPVINASSVFFRVYNASSDANLSLMNASLTYPNGTELAFYNASEIGWTTNSTGRISEVSVLMLASPTDLSGESLGYWTYEDGHVVVLEIA
jgi:hypothetical protein